MSNTAMDLLIKALSNGNQNQAVAEARKLCEAGVGRERIVTEGIEVAMNRMEAKCTVEEFNLLEIMLVGRAAMGVMKELYPPTAPRLQPKGAVVIASLEGDVHDLGKNILKMVLTAKGYRVVDCGKDCSVEKLIDTVKQEGAHIIGVSSLITTVIPQVRLLRELAVKKGLEQVKILAGGAAIKQASPQSLNVDFVAENVFDGVSYLDRILEVTK